MTSTISRRQILSRSRDAGLDRYHQQKQRQQMLQQKNGTFAPYEDYEEMWFSHEHLFKDHIAEVLRKWEQIDDEIWAKIIFMSRNRRIAKAYVRVPAVIIDGTDNGFDGYRVGLNGFEDPFRDSQTDQLMQHIDKGCRIGIDDSGNILIKRYSQANVYVKSYPLDFSRSCVENSVIRAKGCLEAQKKYIIFDMAKFEMAMMEEMKSAYPDRSKLEQQCIVVIGFVRDNNNSILDMPIYIMLINIVALDMLKSKLNPVLYKNISNTAHQNANNHIKNQSMKNINSNGQSKIRVPEFVSIFQQDPDTGEPDVDEDDDLCDNDVEREEEEEEAIYGHIGDLDSCREYLSATWANEYDVQNRYRFDPHRQNHQMNSGYFNNHHHHHLHHQTHHHVDNGPQSMPTLSANIRYQHQHRRDQQRFGDSTEQLQSSTTNRPPKLPPRDKKKLSKQINTIKSARRMVIHQSNHQNDDQNQQSSRLVEIPSPDYHQDHHRLQHHHHHHRHPNMHQDRRKETNVEDGANRDAVEEDENLLSKMFQHRLSRRKIQNKNKQSSDATAGGGGNQITVTPKINQENGANIYGTIVAKNSNTNNQNNNNNSTIIGRRYAMWDKHQTGPNWLNGGGRGNLNHYRTGKSMPANLQLCATYQQPARGINRNQIDPIADEDPYYSGLEARVTSNRLVNATIGHNHHHHHNNTNKMKGLNWMMRKVLSANYINMLTSKRHKKKIPKSKSSNESSTDSDPYVSINDVYEPIYGYGHANGRINYGWPTMQTRLKPAG